MRNFAIALLATGLVAVSWAQADEAQDVAALRALDQAYASEWIKGDADGVLALFTHDATLVPHHGDAPIQGKEAIRTFWFNPEHPSTVVVEWQRDTQEIVISGDMAVVRGRSSLSWEFQGTRTTIPEGNYVMVATRAAEAWLIRMLTWNDDPRTWMQENIE